MLEMFIESVLVGVKKLDKEGKIPVYSSEEAAGADLHSVEEVTIQPGERKLVRTGIAIELKPGFQAEVRPRSGLALKHGITVVNTPGTIDSDYRGEIGVILINHGDKPFEIKVGDRIAQLVIMPVILGDFSWTSALTESARGEGGFGSTGV